MSKNVKIAFCTDFSANANLALESLLFNTWIFAVGIDILHLVERKNEESNSKLKELKEHIELSTFNVSEVNTFLFKKEEKENLINQLNSGKYLSIILGLEGVKRSAGMGSFIRSVYRKVNCNLTIVPIAHEIRTEFKLLVVLEYKNLKYLYMLLRVQAYLSFNCTKLSIVIRKKENLSHKKVLEIGGFVNELFPNVENEIIAHNPVNCNGYLLDNIKRRNFDYCIVFKGDFFDKYMLKVFKNRPKGHEYTMKVVRSIPQDSDIETLEKGGKVDKTLEIRDM